MDSAASEPEPSSSLAPAPRPQPGLVKTIGILNILFGGLLLLCGLGCVASSASAILGTTPMQIDPKTAQTVSDEFRNQRIRDLSAREKAAKTDQDKERIAKELDDVRARHLKVEDEIDFPKVNAELAWVRHYLLLDVLTGPILNLFLVVAGIGLILRQNWARVLGIVTATLKIVRLVALSAFLVGAVLPHVGAILDALLKTEAGRQLVTQVIEQQQAQAQQADPLAGPPPQPMPQLDPKEAVRMMRGLSTVYAIFFVCVGSIYPIIVVILLTRPGARAACAAVEESPGEFPGFQP
jgi:hypothetical protein